MNANSIDILIPKGFGGKDGKKALEEIIRRRPVEEPPFCPTPGKPLAQFAPTFPVPQPKPTFKERAYDIISKGAVGLLILSLPMTMVYALKTEDDLKKPIEQVWDTPKIYFQNEVRQNKVRYEESRYQLREQARLNHQENKYLGRAK